MSEALLVYDLRFLTLKMRRIWIIVMNRPRLRIRHRPSWAKYQPCEENLKRNLSSNVAMFFRLRKAPYLFLNCHLQTEKSRYG
jgi:hypothetical protein